MTQGKRSGGASHRPIHEDDMRLSDLIPALKAQHVWANAVLQRIDPAIIDELRAYTAHRHVELMDLAADCLERLASDASDIIWQLGIERQAAFHDDPAAALLGSILREALRSRLQREFSIRSATAPPALFIRFSRSGHPYTAV